MNQINLVGIETRSGYRIIELHQGDITNLDFHVDVLVLSAFASSYSPNPGTVIRALRDTHGINAYEQASNPAIDLRTALGFWVSHPLPQSVPIGRLACVEIRGSGQSVEDALDNAFAGLLLLEAKRVLLPTVALPLLGTGLQKLPADQIASLLVARAREYLERASTTDRLVFVEIDHQKASLVSDALDRLLGRERVTLPQQQLVQALRQDVSSRLFQLNPLFKPDGIRLQQDWISLLQRDEVRSVEFGVQARKLVELVVSRLDVSTGHLANRIRNLENGGRVAPWVCGYMNVLRHLGNEAVHENHSGTARVPSVISPADLTAGLFCVQRLLDVWAELVPATPANTSDKTHAIQSRPPMQRAVLNTGTTTE